ncbi:response regulator [Sagittula sp.]|uniref:response regulator n=1 Tax=Sagittula sp. TaxID=2038081 RepID=UPI00351924A6
MQRIARKLEFPEPQAVATPRTRCLVVDDDVFDRAMLGRCIGKGVTEVEVLEADSIAAARAHLDRVRPDIVLVDHRLPDGQGTEFARELMSDEAFADVLICVVSSVDPSLLDPGVATLPKDALSRVGLTRMVEEFLERRRLSRASADGALVADFGAHVSDSLDAAAARMLRTLRRAKSGARRTIPRSAMNDLDQLEQMLLALSDVRQRVH